MYVAHAAGAAGKPRDTGAAGTRGGGRVPTTQRPAYEASCPFCPGNEVKCEPPTATVEVDGTWVLRSFANAYPTGAFTKLNGAFEMHVLGAQREALNMIRVRTEDRAPPRRFPIFHPLAHASAAPDRCAACGSMEVLVSSRSHAAGLAELSPESAGALVLLARDRAVALSARPGARCVRVFCNHGARAGSSLLHAHWQVVALGFEPPAAAARCAAQRRHATCPVDEVLESAPVVYEDDLCVAVAVVAARAGTVWVAPKKRVRRLRDCA